MTGGPLTGEPNWLEASGLARLPTMRIYPVLMVAVMTLSFWSPADLYIRLVAIVLTVAAVAVAGGVPLTQRHHLTFFAIASIFAIYSCIAIFLVDKIEVSAPAELLKFKRYHPQKYVPSMQDMALRVVYLTHSLLFGVALLQLFRGACDVPQRLQRILGVVLAINVGAWILQVTVHHLFGMTIDLMGAGRNLAATGGGGVIFRGSGLFSEPGTYACVVFAILACCHLVVRRVSMLQLAAVTTLFLSFSFFGWILGCGFLMAVVPWSRILRSAFVFIMIPVLVAVSLVAGFLVYGPVRRYLELRLYGESISYSVYSKIYAVKFWLERGFDRKLTGSFGLNDCGCLYQDSGAAFSLVFEYGLFGLVALALLIGWVRWDLRALVLLGLLLATKLQLTSPALFGAMVLFACLVLRKAKTPLVEA